MAYMGYDSQMECVFTIYGRPRFHVVRLSNIVGEKANG